MSATINKWDNWQKDFVPVVGEGTVTAFVEPANKTMVLLYVEVMSGIASIEMKVEDESIPGTEFSVSQFDGTNVSNQVMNFTEAGKYRIPVPVAKNEEKLHIVLTGSDVQLWSMLESESN